MPDDVLGTVGGDFDVQLYGLSAVVYAERGDEILLLKRQVGAMPGQWFLPGGAVERDELPEDAARRELVEESGLGIDGDLELVGAYPIWVYGGDCLQLSYRGRVTDAEVVISDEHSAARWIDPVRMRANMSDAALAGLAAGNDRVSKVLRNIRSDLDRYLRRIGRG